MTPAFRRTGYVLIGLNVASAFWAKSAGDIELAVWNVIAAALAALVIIFCPRASQEDEQ